ncbi:MobA/MobL family protein [Shimia thalassica]|uniref:MobA/MobL family protein n=1 Tax=Shimia thalassica TaxID=1715693 RepID=UPI003D66344A
MAVDVAIHAPHREGDQRNHHAHVLTTTRQLEPEGFTVKARVLDAAKTGGVEIAQMREVWAELQNRALERAGLERGLAEGEIERVDHRSLEVQRSDAMSRGDDLTAQGLDRAPELKLGPAANAMERRERRVAERDGRAYQPVTERGAVVHAARQAREVFAEMRERLEMAREAYDVAREAGQGRVSAGLAALRAGTSKEHEPGASDDIRERLAQIAGRDRPVQDALERGGQSDEEPARTAQERLRAALGEDLTVKQGVGLKDGDKPSIRERLGDVLNKPRERLDVEADIQKEREAKEEKEIARVIKQDRGLSL